MSSPAFLFLSNMYPSNATPAFGIFVKKLVDYFMAQGVAVDVIAIRGRKDGLLQKMLGYLKLYLSAFCRLCVTRRIIYLHYVAHTSLPVLLVLLFRPLKVIAHVHGGDVMSAAHVNARWDKIKFACSKRLLTKATLIVVPSHYFAQFLVEQYQISLDKIIVSPSGGVDVSRFSPKQQRDSTEQDNTIKLGFVGRLDPGKGVETLLSALEQLNNQETNRSFLLDIVGSGELESVLRQQIEQKGLDQQVTFYPAQSHSSLPDFFRTFDYFVFPTELNESLGLVGLEAMACGKPIVTTAIAGINDYFEQGRNGFAFEKANISSLVRCLTQLPDIYSDEYQRMQRCARQTALRFDAAKVNQSLLEKLCEI